MALAELALIERIRRGGRSRNSAVNLGIGDDCAILQAPPGHDLVVTTDFSLEGRHFRRDWHSPASAGHRALARGLSDIAAMGAKPLAVFLSLALPPGYDLRWLDGFMAGFNALAALHGVELAGGDTAQAPGHEILADVMVLGAVRRGKALRRSGARAGDLIYVTGTLGGSAVELAALAVGKKSPRRATPNHPQSFPQPRIAVGLELVRRRLASACMDLSDGLSTDLTHLCKASEVGARLDAAAIPLAAKATLDQALRGGEDYELLFTSSVSVPKVIAGVSITRIGEITTGTGVKLGSATLKPQGWQHFRTTNDCLT